MAQARAARMRAPAARAPVRGGGGGGGSRGLGRASQNGSSARQDATTPGSTGEASELDAVLDLQEVAGNQAVVQLLASGAAAAVTPPNGFTATNRALGVVLSRQIATGRSAVVQREMAVDADPKLRVDMLRDAIRFEPLFYRFVINLDKTTEALSNMTADDGRSVKSMFQAQKKWNLGWIFSAVEQPIEDGPPATNNLSQSDRTKLLNLLGGTAIKPAAAPAAPVPVATPAPAADGGEPTPAAPAPVAPAPAAPAPDPDAARVAKNRLRVTAASIKTAVTKKDVKTAIALIPASMEERREIDALYNTMYGQTAYMALFTKLPGKQGQRAAALWYDEKDDADRLALEAAEEERDKGNKEAKEIESTGMSILAPVAKKKRLEAQQKLEAEVKRVAAAGDQSTLAGRAASRERLKKVLDTSGPKGKLGKRIGVDSDPILRAIAEGNEVDVVAARLARADATKDVTAAEVEAAMREVRTLAEDQADLTIDMAPDTLEPLRPYMTKAIVDGCFGRLKEAFDKHQTRRPFDAMLAGRGGTDERAAKTLGVEIGDLRDLAGQTADYNRNKALFARGGELDEWGELFFALTKKPKDIERVRQILGSKTYSQVQTLAELYANRSGRSLEADLAGTELEQKMAGFFTGDAREDLQERRSLLAGGAWDRTRAETTVPRDADAATREAHLLAAEGEFLFRRLAGLERRVLENRGLFAEARDWAGNEEKRILDNARNDMWAAKSQLGKALNPDRGSTWKEGEEGTPLTADLGEARRAVVELRRLDKRLSHAVTIYKESTKKAYEEFVDLVVNAATIVAGLGVTGIWITAIRTTAATVGTKLLMKGSDYTVDEFFADIQGGMAGVAGDLAKLGVKQLVAPYVAAKIMRLARRVGMSKEMYAQVQGRIGPLVVRQAEHTYGTAVSNIAQGKDWTEGQGLDERIKGEAIGAVTAPIDEKLKARKAAAAATKRQGGAGEDEGGTPRTPDADEPGAARPTGEADTPAAPDADADAGGGDAADVPKTSMALPEPPRPRPTKRDDDPVRHPAPQGEPGAGGTKAGPKGGAVASSPDVEFPAGATQLNTKAGPPPIPGSLPAPSADELKPRPRSEALRSKADQTLADVGRVMAMVRDNPQDDYVRNIVEADLRAAQHAWALAHGQAAPTADEFHRLNAEEKLADVEAEYADVLGLPGSPKRVAAEEQVRAATAAHARAADAVRKAEASVRKATNEAPNSPLMTAAQAELDTAASAFRAAEVELKRANGEKTKATVGMARGDWRRRRAEIALHGAKRDVEKAHGRPEPEDTVGPAGRRPIQGPPERFPPSLWDQELVIQLQNPHSLREAQGLVVKMLHEDPNREVGLFRNSETGEYIVVRGKATKVTVETGPMGEAGPRGKGMMQRWKELLGADGDVGHWELVVHTHPNEFGQPINPLNRYPSSGRGDFGVVHDDSEATGGQPKQSEIWYFDGVRMQRTQFGVDFGHDDAYWIQLPGQARVRFPDIYAYERYLTKEMAPFGITPKFEPPPPMRIGDGSATAASGSAPKGTAPVAESPTARGVETGVETGAGGVDSRWEAAKPKGKDADAGARKVDPNFDIANGPVAPSVPSTKVYRQDSWSDYEILERPQEGLSDSYRLRHRGSGEIFIFKPTKGEQSVPRAEERGIRKGEQAPRTKATELAAGRLGIETPAVDLVRIGNRPGSLTKWIGLNSLGRLEKTNNDEFQRIVKSEEFRKLRATVDVLDYLTNNLDRNRNYGNYLYELDAAGKVKRLVPIDHDLTFTATGPRANLEAYTRPLPDRYEPAMIERLVALSADRQRFIDEITPLVGDAAAPGVLLRLDALLEDAKLKQPQDFAAASSRRP